MKRKLFVLFISATALLSCMATKPAYLNFTPKVKKEMLAKLPPEQRAITQKNGTEIAGTGQYYNHFKKGIYVDVVSGQPLFSSRDKYQADSGWPAFTKPITENAIKITTTESILGEPRHEVSSSIANSHLGDIFHDRYVKNPPSDGKRVRNNTYKGMPRYCINSASLRFIPLSKMKAEGYGKYIKYVTTSPRNEE